VTRSIKTLDWRVKAALRFGVVSVVSLVVLLPVAGVVAPQNAQAAASAGSAVTVNSTGYFNGFRASISQTKDLVNQVVDVTWTSPIVNGEPVVQAVQIMECWGDDPSGPPPEQCQYGANAAQGKGGLAGSSRAVGGLEPALTDTIETHPNVVGFRPVTGQGGDISNFFDANTTNEINLAPTYSDGTGEVLFTTQTAREAPGLGCGAAITDQAGKTGRHGCWLVIVPRGDHDLTSADVAKGGFVKGPGQPPGAQSSPLSATNWQNAALFIPLEFQPLGTTCDITTAQRPTFGAEVMTGAMGSWESGLCGVSKAVFGYSQVSDDLARTTIASGQSGLGFVARPIPADQLPAASKPVYAPVAISGVGISFLIERIASAQATPEERAQVGRPVTNVNLTQRLVAKLLTQSYRLGGSIWNPALDNSQYSLTKDPEFLAINPDFNHLQYTPGIGEVLVPFIPSDSARLLWEWVNADASARAFLNGEADNDSPIGTPKHPLPSFVNPSYKKLALPLATYPKQDPYCYNQDGFPPLCTLDAHPYANTMQDVAIAISRGDTLARTSFNGLVWSKSTPQSVGYRNLMGVTDTASAARYGLAFASLKNANGDFVAPTDESMLAAVKSMKTDASTGTLVPDVSTKTAGAYPLTQVTYAVVLPSALDATARKDYSTFLSYAATAGQQVGVKPGQLPVGYVPLTPSMQIQTAAAGDALAIAPSPTPTVTPSTTPTPDPTYTSPGGSNVPPVTTSTTPVTNPSDTGTPTVAPAATSAPPVRESVTTPHLTAGTGAYVIAGALILGAVAALGGPAVSWLASRGRL
jgi:hypothetical protein